MSIEETAGFNGTVHYDGELRPHEIFNYIKRKVPNDSRFSVKAITNGYSLTASSTEYDSLNNEISNIIYTFDLTTEESKTTLIYEAKIITPDVFKKKCFNAVSVTFDSGMQNIPMSRESLNEFLTQQ